MVRRNASFGEDFAAYFSEKYKAGWSDDEIRKGWKCDRHAVRCYRRNMGLPHNRFSAHVRERVAERTRKQAKAAGVRNLAEVRSLAFRKYAKRYGWPEDLRPREVHILNAILKHGPMTRQQMCETIGLRWNGSRRSLRCKYGRGSYVANLLYRGLLVSLGKIVKGRGRGSSRQLYTIPLFTERKVPA
jgi:hypothetical protein